MSGDSKIEWCDASWNPTRGCAIKSPGCKNCYAMREANRHARAGGAYAGLVDKAGFPERPIWTGEVRLVPEALDFPLRRRIPSDIFVDSMSDLFFGEPDDREACARRGVPFNPVPFEFIAAVFGVMGAASWHRFQVLTKRDVRAMEFFEWLAEQRNGPRSTCLWYARKFIGLTFSSHEPRHDQDEPEWPFPNVWLGVSVEDKLRRSRIRTLAFLPAAIRFVSFEPLLEDVVDDSLDLRGVDWAIMGGESGVRPRVCHTEWIRKLVMACRATGTAPFVKQLGTRAQHDVGHPEDAPTKTYTLPIIAGRKGERIELWPEHLRVREYPTPRGEA